LSLLADSNELIQDAASRGLTLVYDASSSALKEDLVYDLLKTFSGTKRNRQDLAPDTELFQPGQITSDNGPISTYQDVLSLASEAGDPSLVYKFMSLTSHASLWSSARGAAFGIGAILEKAKVSKELESNSILSETLIPKLYRYRFDPYTSVREAMCNMWDSLVSNSPKTILESFDIILEELLKSIGDTQWRVREASTRALCDLIKNAPMERYISRMIDIWAMGFRALDDIKQSVRLAGVDLVTALNATLIRQVESQELAQKAETQQILGMVIPLILGPKGLQSSVEDVQHAALETIVKLTKNEPKILRPYVSLIVSELLGVVTTLEPALVSYLSLNASKYGITLDDIEKGRMSALKSSPVMTSMEHLCNILSPDEVPEFIERFQRTVSTSLGSPSLFAASKLMVTLYVQHNQLIAPYSDSFLNLISSQLDGRSDVVANAYAAAAGYVCAHASEPNKLKFFHHLQKLYFDADSKKRYRVAVVAESIGRHSPTDYETADAILTKLVFIGQYDPDEKIKPLLRRCYDDHIGGTRVLREQVNSITRMCLSLLDDTEWWIRSLGAQSLSDISKIVEDQSVLAEIIGALLQLSARRVWDGKSAVMDALLSIAMEENGYVSGNDEIISKMQEAFVVESQRKEHEYAEHQFISLCRFI
ncbi:hypothetical protein CANCADRAFT_11396, partial [Tortispora caseinolytica NRRL Y-17796]